MPDTLNSSGFGPRRAPGLALEGLGFFAIAGLYHSLPSSKNLHHRNQGNDSQWNDPPPELPSSGSIISYSDFPRRPVLKDDDARNLLEGEMRRGSRSPVQRIFGYRLPLDTRDPEIIR